MTLLDKINNRKVGIIGAARSGLSAAELVQKFNGLPFVSDNRSDKELRSEMEHLRKLNIPYEVGGHSELLLSMDYLIVSPGVPLTIGILASASERGIPVFSELEFASWTCRGKVIAITGSNGKTTTTTLVGEIYKAAGLKTFVGGNIGLPFSSFAVNVPNDGYAVLEVSNFQLETIADFRPDTSVILNLTPDHIDRHGTFENYVKAKLRITENQSAQNNLVLNADDPHSKTLDIKTKASKTYFTIENHPNFTAFVESGFLCGNYDGTVKKIIEVDKIKIKGPHNLQNASAAVAVASHYDISPEVIASVLETFGGVEHRLEFIAKVAGISFINDSKATNVEAVCYALQSVSTPLYLIAGGRDKDADFTTMIPYGENIAGIIAIGEAKEKIFKELGGTFATQFAVSLEEAVSKAFELASPGETVLLSPGCASFDMFDNFEHRGDVFKQAVANLKNGKNQNEKVQS